MKDSELQDIKPVYIHEARYSADDEISLIDLAIVLVRRWKMITFIIIFTIALGAVYTLTLKQPTRYYTFSTSLEVGSQIINETIKPLSSSKNSLAKLQHVFIPQMQRERKSSNSNDENNYEIIPSIPKGSNIIVLEVQGTEDQSDLLLNALQDLTQRLIQDHKRSYESIKQNITASREAAKAEIALLNAQKDKQAGSVAFIKNKIDIYNSQLASLQSTHVIAPPMKSLKSTSSSNRSKKLIIIVAAFAGIFLAVFVAFFAEFVSNAKEEFVSKVKDQL